MIRMSTILRQSFLLPGRLFIPQPERMCPAYGRRVMRVKEGKVIGIDEEMLSKEVQAAAKACRVRIGRTYRPTRAEKSNLAKEA